MGGERLAQIRDYLATTRLPYTELTVYARELLRDRDEWEQIARGHFTDLQQERDTVAAIQSERDEARKDGERLAWLINNIEVPDALPLDAWDDPIAAIDAAMTAEAANAGS